MTPSELAALLPSTTERCEVTRALAAQAKAAGLVVVFGASDDLMEFRGAINDEVGVYDGGTAWVDSKGLLPDRESIEDDEELRDYFARQPKAIAIEALWASEGEYSWTYRTQIPHATFDVVDDDGPYCRGIVFALADASGVVPLD
ncbi:MAG: hypothetical protein ACRER5_03075 [Pseudomonas sp.]